MNTRMRGRRGAAGASKRGRSEAGNNQRMAGRMGRSQAVTTFGVGSIYELRTFKQGKATLHSVMVAGLDAWDRFRNDMQTVREDVLKKVLKVDYFLAPPTEPDFPGADAAAIPAVRFPAVLYCDKCGRVGRVGQEFTDLNFAGPRCASAGCTGRAVPFRFVIACHDKSKPDTQPGHIDDFPYAFWAHRGSICANPAVYLTSKSEMSGLSGLVLKCRGCDAPGNSMESVFAEGALGRMPCRGHRPWLFDHEDGCQRPVRVLQRGASNTYFPVTASALSIPPYSDRLFSLVGKALILPVLDLIRSGQMPEPTLIALLRNVRGLNDPGIYTNEQILETARITAGLAEVRIPADESEQREVERNALLSGRRETGQDDEFIAVPVADFQGYPLLNGYFDAIVQVHRLREVRALRGFQRVDPSFVGDSFSMQVAPISKGRINWLPAIETRGEGIYVEVCRDKILEWANSDQVKTRSGRIGRNLDRVCDLEDRPRVEHPSSAFIMVHTLSHLLMKQLALECGYSSNSLRERIYAKERADGSGYAGILIYTASSSADGTLGGLVSQSDPKPFESILRAALQSARWCSSDPLCGESHGQGADALNLAACHACALIAETSCEKRNYYLDRGLVIGTPESPQSAFFLGTLDDLE